MKRFALTPEGRAGWFSRQARLVLWTEAITRAFWPPITLAAAFLAAALFGLPQTLPPTLHLLLLLGLGLALGALVLRGAWLLKAPGRDAPSRRLEQESGLAHRPFVTLADHPAGDPGPVGQALFRLHQARQRAAIRRLRLAVPRPGLPERDPLALRLAVLIALILGWLAAGSQAPDRVAQALDPGLGGARQETPIEAWIKPPAYTALAPILLKPDDDRTIAVPTGSTIVAHVTGSDRTPRLLFGSDLQKFAPVAGGFGLTRTLTEAGTIRIRQGWSTLARWTITIIPDRPPTVAFAEQPEATGSGALRLAYHAQDDYGVVSVSLKVRAVPNHRPVAAPPIDAMLTAGHNDKDLSGSSFEDLTAHPWAGMQVLAKLVATDAAGQTGESSEIPLVLPERNFLDPVARAVAAARKQVILDRTPWREIASDVAALSVHPETYRDDLTVFLALRTAATRLADGDRQDPETVAEIEDLLWNAALRIEDGSRPDAEKQVKDAETALEKALANPNTPSSEIKRLTDALKSALDRYMDALAENLRQRLARGEQLPQLRSDSGQTVIDRKDLSQLLDQMNELAGSGARQAAKDLLSALKSMLENLRPGMAGQGDGKAQQALERLKQLDAQQRGLMKQDGTGSGAAKQQEELRQSLGDAMRDIDGAGGTIPRALGSADRSMRGASRALQQGDGAGAKQEQGSAIGALDEAIQDLSQQLAKEGTAGFGVRSGNGRDPLGRGNLTDGSEVKVPTEREMQRSREILDELRRRAGERERPRLERDYIDRLLREF